jgi:hypothetical protein
VTGDLGSRYDELHRLEMSGESPAKLCLLVARLLTRITAGTVTCADVVVHRNKFGA